MTDVPKDIPVTLPAPVGTVATVVVTLVHAPPEVTSLSVTVEPLQMVVGPVIAAGTAGDGFTVTGCITYNVPQV